MKSHKLKQKQTARLTAKQIQLMQMIGLSNTEVEDRIQSELENNPALEEGEERDYGEEVAEQIAAENEADRETPEDEMMLGDYATEDDIPAYKLKQVEEKQTPREEIPFAEASSLQEFLNEQIGFTKLNDEEVEIAEYIIGSLDEDGYLRRHPEALVDDLAIRLGIYTDRQTVDKVIEEIRKLEPAGIGAKDLQDCLLLQLKRKKKTDAVVLALEILQHHFKAFSYKHYEKLMTRLDVTDDQLREASRIITSLNPRPGLDFTTRLEDTLHTVIPDFLVEEQDGDLVVSLNSEGVPPVRVNTEFVRQMKEYSGDIRRVPESKKETAKFVKQKIDDAKWFVEALRQRQRTLIFTMQAIVEMQKAFFYTGDVALLKPLILQDVADVTGLDVSTISRVTSTKYVQTEFGIFSLKYFFSEGTVTDSGKEVSTRHVREVIAEIVDEEDKSSPLSDESISALLKERGYNVARRTIAKYRDQMNIPVARLRKEI